MYAWRVDDITWENDIAAYRVYGPALQRSGEKAYGIDVWLKSTKELDVDHRYAVTWQSNIDKAFFRSIGNQEGVDFVDRATSFHLDHGQGLDCYNVGPSLGCGTPAVMICRLLLSRSSDEGKASECALIRIKTEEDLFQNKYTVRL